MKTNIWVERAAQRVQRRIFLKAVGIGVAAPLAWRLSSQAFAQTTGRPKRLVIFFHPHGVPPEHFNPKQVAGSATDFTLSDSGVSVLGPLEKYKSQVTVLQGFKYPGASTHEGILNFLSGFGTGNVDEMASRTTVEHAIGNALGVKPLVLGAVPHRQWGIDKDGKAFWDGQPVVPEKSPLKAYDTVFGSLGGATPAPAPTGPDLDTTALQKLTELNRRQLTQLQAEVASHTAEKNKLQIHLDSLASRGSMTPGGGGPAPVSCTAKPTIKAVEDLRALAQGQGDEFFLKEENFPAIYAAQLEIAAQAIRCNARQIVALQPMYTNAELDFKFMGSAGAHHTALSHTGPQFGSGGTTMNMETRVPFAKAQRWFYEQLQTRLLTALEGDDPADPGHSILSNTLIYCCSEIGEGAWHPSTTTELKQAATAAAMSYLPLVLIGGGGGAVKPGQVLKFSPDRPAADIYLGLGRAMGAPNITFPGTSGAVTEFLAS